MKRLSISVQNRKTVCCKAGLVLVLTLVGPVVAGHAQQPDNDFFVNRMPITGYGTYPGANFSASAESLEPDHAEETASVSVWWEWTAPVTESVDIDTFDSDFDTILAVYTGDVLSSLTELASNDDNGCGTQSGVRFEAAAGTTYQIAVDGFDDEGNIELRFQTSPLPPENDNFANRIAITGYLTRTGVNVGATAEAGEPDHVGGESAAASVWWRWTPLVSGRVEIDTFGSCLDTVLAVYTGTSLGNLIGVAANDDNGGDVQSRVRFDATTGNIYQIAVDGFDGEEEMSNSVSRRLRPRLQMTLSKIQP